MAGKAIVRISACSRRNPEWEMFTALTNAQIYAAEREIYSIVDTRVGGSLICRERNRAIRDFIKDDHATHLFTIDDDVSLPQDAIVKLVEAQKPIIGGLYRLKDHKGARLSSRIERPSMWPMIIKAGLVSDAKYVAGGCCMITKSAAITMANAYDESLSYTENLSQEKTWALYQPYIHTHKSGFREYLSEDWAFCQRASDIGIQSSIHGGVLCGHWGLHRFDFYYPKKFVDLLGEQFSESDGKITEDDVDPEVLEEHTI